MDRKSLGARIKAQRIKCGLSQEEFAEKLHCTSSHIGKVENGKVGVSIELLVSIANELQTTVDQLCRTPTTIRNKLSFVISIGALETFR